VSDPRVLEGIARVEAAVRESKAALADASKDTLADLAAQRMVISKKHGDVKAQIEALHVRIQKARRGARTLAQSDSDRAALAEALIDLDDGKPVPKMPKRLGESEPIKDATEAHALLTKAREQLKRLEAQMDALDATLAAAGPRPIVPAL
jgi:hypothetical protein